MDAFKCGDRIKYKTAAGCYNRGIVMDVDKGFYSVFVDDCPYKDIKVPFSIKLIKRFAEKDEVKVKNDK